MDILTVGQIVQKIKRNLETTFSLVSVEGEISNYSPSSSGHIYFTISDENSSLSVAVFRPDVMRNPLIKRVKNGDQVVISGPINVFAKRGTFQLIGKMITPAGEGKLKLQFEQLKKRLAAEGLFDVQHKQDIPEFPKKVCLITAIGSAAYEDFMSIYQQKSTWMNITVSGALVQGEKAPTSILKALRNAIKFSLDKPERAFDVIVLSRGGGSMEDLWAFNDEALAWEIFNCPIPVISAVGHEVDYTICDFVADLRCETPSAAAQTLTEAQLGLKLKLSKEIRQLNIVMNQKLSQAKYQLQAASPKMMISVIFQQLNVIKSRLARNDIRGKLPQLLNIYDTKLRLDDARHRLRSLMDKKCLNIQNIIGQAKGLLEALGPQNTLDRGYTYIRDEEQGLIKSLEDFKKLPADTNLKIGFADGTGDVRKLK